MPVISCGINIFDYDQTVYLVNENSKEVKVIGKSTYENLEHLLVTLCDEYNVNTIYLGGIMQYKAPLKDRIEKESLARYNRKIEVIINE